MTGAKAGRTGENPGMLKCKFKKNEQERIFQNHRKNAVTGRNDHFCRLSGGEPAGNGPMPGIPDLPRLREIPGMQ